MEKSVRAVLVAGALAFPHLLFTCFLADVCRLQHVDLTSLPFFILTDLFEITLPKKTRFIQSLSWDHKELFLHASFVRLFAAAVHVSRKLKHIRVGCYQLGTRTPERTRKFDESLRIVFTALESVARRLESLSISFEDARNDAAQPILASLASARELTRLELFPSSIPEAITVPFLSSFSHLQHLTSLELWFPVPNTIASIPTAWPLKRLLLDCTGPSDPPTFLSFISRFSNTLTRLETFNTPRESFFDAYPLDADGKAPFQLPLPHLASLVLGQPYDHSVLPYVLASPVRYLEIKWLNTEAMSELKAFLEAKKGTLEEVAVWLFGREDRGNLMQQRDVEGWCKERGIAFRWIDESEEDDEEEEEKEEEGEISVAS